MNRLTPIALALPLLSLSTIAFAASTPQAVLDDPNRPVEAVAAELGITPLQFATCFAGVTRPGRRPNSMASASWTTRRSCCPASGRSTLISTKPGSML